MGFPIEKNPSLDDLGDPHVGKPRCMQLPAIFGPGYHQGTTRVSHQEQIAEYLMEMQQCSWPIRPF